MVGTSKTPRWSNGNIDWERVYKDYVKDIIRNQIAPNTGRGLMYILKAKGILVKSDYNQLMTHLRDWRKEGRILWSEIADGSGRGVINDFIDYQPPEKFIDSRIKVLKYGGEIYRNILNADWRWHGQPTYIEFWLEKHAIASTVAALTGNRYVKVAFNRGNPGWGFMHDNCKRLKKELHTIDENGEKIRRSIYLYYLGDNDKQGNNMDKEIRNQLDFFGMLKLVNFERIAITDKQVQDYGLPVNFESGKGYEVDALNAYKPKEFAKLIDSHIEPHFDRDVHDRILEKEEYQSETIDDRIRSRIKFLDEDNGIDDDAE
jgi:hypothetical protein